MINWRALIGKKPNGANFLSERTSNHDLRKTVAIAEPNPYEAAAPGREFEQFSKEAAIVLGRELDLQDLEKDLINELGLDELDIAECLIIAETAWGIEIPRRTLTSADLTGFLGQYKTLSELIAFVKSYSR